MHFKNFFLINSCQINLNMTRNLSLISWLTLFNKSSLALSQQLSVILALPLGLKMAIQLVTWHDG